MFCSLVNGHGTFSEGSEKYLLDMPVVVLWGLSSQGFSLPFNQCDLCLRTDLELETE